MLLSYGFSGWNVGSDVCKIAVNLFVSKLQCFKTKVYSAKFLLCVSISNMASFCQYLTGLGQTTLIKLAYVIC